MAQIAQTRTGKVLTLTIDRPEKKNALTNAMYGQLADALEGVRGDDGVRCVVITGAGDTFTAGNDLGDFAAVASGDLKHLDRHVHRVLDVLDELREAGGRRGARPRRRHRHDDAAALRPGLPRRHRASLDPLRRPRSGARGGFQPAAAGSDRLCPRVRDVRARREGRCGECARLGSRQQGGAGRRAARRRDGGRGGPCGTATRRRRRHKGA